MFLHEMMDEMMGDLDSSSSSEDEEEILTPSQEEAQREMEIERKKLKEEKIKQDEKLTDSWKGFCFL